VALSTEFGKQLNKEHFIYFWQFAKGAKITFEAATAGDHIAFSRQKVSRKKHAAIQFLTCAAWTVAFGCHKLHATPIIFATPLRKLSKGHGNEADFLGFLQKLVPRESLSSRSYFGFEFAEIFVIKKRLLVITDTGSRRLRVSVIQGVANSPHY
jgi:hypothetical protein